MRKKKTSSHRIQGQNLDVYDGIEAALSQCPTSDCNQSWPDEDDGYSSKSAISHFRVGVQKYKPSAPKLDDDGGALAVD